MLSSIEGVFLRLKFKTLERCSVSILLGYNYSGTVVFVMVRKSNKNAQAKKESSKGFKQLKLGIFPSEFNKKLPIKQKQIVINRIGTITKYDEMIITVEFKLIPSKTVFSKIKSTLWFDDQEVKSALIEIPQKFGFSDEFQLKSELDMRGINAGVHTIRVELNDLFSTVGVIKEEIIEYVPIDKTAGYRKIPLVKKIAGCDFVVISRSEMNKLRKQPRKS